MTSAGTGSIAIGADPLGEFIFVANGESDDVAVYRIDSSTGAPAMVPGAPFPSGRMPCGVAADPLGRFLYVGNWVSNDISCWQIERSTGTLLPLVCHRYPKPDG
jgi:6-phosphogluconolactonase (cycloisomerase 2 family)